MVINKTEMDRKLELLCRRAQNAYSEVIAQREEILRAFIAKYGCQPDEIEQIIQTTCDGVRWYVRNKKNNYSKEEIHDRERNS